MSRLPKIAFALAIVAALVALGVILSAEKPRPQTVYGPMPEAPEPQAPQPLTVMNRGGVYAGKITDVDGRPIAAAPVLLVAFNTGGGHQLTAQGAGPPEDFSSVPIIGDYRIAGEQLTDKDGRFRIAADSQSWVRLVLSYHKGYFIEVQKVEAPREDIHLVLQRGGRVIGHVVDDATGRPVSRARVDVFLQNITRPPPEIPEGATRGMRGKTGKPLKLSPLVMLGRFLTKELGERVWGLSYEDSESLRFYTDENGNFELGPLGNTVQLEFVVTHKDYKWYDFDTDDGKHYAKRTVVQPGETVERTFRMRPGEFIAGRVIDAQGRGVSSVLVEVESISEYFRHHWYKDKTRSIRTDRNGYFRVGGLAIGDQNIRIHHASVGTQHVYSVKVGTENLVIELDEFGGLQGRVEGLAKRPPRGLVTVNLYKDQQDAAGRRRNVHRLALRDDNTFRVTKVLPGEYTVTVRAGKLVSLPVAIEVQPNEVVEETFSMSSGAGMWVLVLGSEQNVVDPAIGTLYRMEAGGERYVSRHIGRQGRIEVEGVIPGTYRLQVTGRGYIPMKTEPFEIEIDRDLRLDDIQLQRFGFLKLTSLLDAEGRVPKQPTTLEYAGADGRWNQLKQVAAPVHMKPGTITVRAVDARKRVRYTKQIEIREGEVTDLNVTLSAE